MLCVQSYLGAYKVVWFYFVHVKSICRTTTSCYPPKTILKSRFGFRKRMKRDWMLFPVEIPGVAVTVAPHTSLIFHHDENN